jgi:chromosome segregation ATPase
MITPSAGNPTDTCARPHFGVATPFGRRTALTVYGILADIVDALRTSHLEHETIRAEMATKSDLGALEAATKAEFASLRAEMATKSDLAALEAATTGALGALEAATKAEFAAIRAEMATKSDLAEIAGGLLKLGLEFEDFRHNTKITLEMISELMTRTGRHEKAIAGLDRRTGRVESHLKLKPLPNGMSDQ